MLCVCLCVVNDVILWWEFHFQLSNMTLHQHTARPYLIINMFMICCICESRVNTSKNPGSTYREICITSSPLSFSYGSNTRMVINRASSHQFTPILFFFFHHIRLFKGPTMSCGAGRSLRDIWEQYYGTLGAQSKYESPCTIDHE